MRLSTHLKGRDYRDLLEIIDLTYSASGPDALFPPLFEKLDRAIGCSGAVCFPLGETGLPISKVRSPVVAEISLQLAREYTEHYWTLDPSYINCCTTRPPNRALRITDLIPISRFLNSEFAIDFAAREPYCWGLGGYVGTLRRPLAGIALHRLRRDRDFSDRDVAFLGAAMPHLSRVLLLFDDKKQRPGATGILILDDVGTVVYTNEAATHILRGKPAQAIPLPIRGPASSHERTIFRSEQGDYAIALQTVPGSYQVISLEPVRHDSLGSRLALMGLTPRQQEIASRVLSGASNKRIAGDLALTEQTVKDHVHAIFRKLGIHRRAELAARVLPLSFDEGG